MSTNLSYREKVILGIVLAVMGVLLTFFLIIKPKNEDIKAENKTLAAEEKKEKEIKTKIHAEQILDYIKTDK